MEFRAKIMVRTIDTGAETTTTIAGTTTIAQIAIETTIGGGEFRGLTNAGESGKDEVRSSELAKWHFPMTAPRVFLPRIVP